MSDTELAMKFLQQYIQSQETGASKLDPNMARNKYRFQYQQKKLQDQSFGASSAISQNNTETFASTSSFCNLKRVGIKDLRVHIPAKGSYLLLRVLEPPILTVGIMVFVEDHLGDVIIMTLYNYVDYTLKVMIEEVIPIGAIFILKEPFMKVAVCGQIVIRCDCPTDIIRVDRTHPLHSPFSKIHWKNSADDSYVSKPLGCTALEWKAAGNKLYKSEKYPEAIEAYSVALKLCKDSELILLLHLNLSAVYLMQEYYELTLKHVSVVMETQPNNMKALYRAGRAYYQLRQFEDAQLCFEQLLKLDSEHQNGLIEFKRCKERLKEQEGHVDIYKLFLTGLLKPSTYIDCADYVGPVEVVPIPGKGRGVVATEDIKPGTLLVLCKAFQVSFDSTGVAANVNTCDFTIDHGSKVKLLAQTCQKMMKNPETFGKLVYKLSTNNPEFDKSYKLYCDETNKNEPIADASRLKKILDHNCFSLVSTEDQVRRFSFNLFDGSGFFIFPSHFNHSCIYNSVWHTYNDIITVRAVTAIKNGSEITIPYWAGREDFQCKQQKFTARGFKCMCILCRLDRSEPDHVHRKRSTLETKHRQLCEEHFSNNSTNVKTSIKIKKEMNELIRGLEMTYNHREKLKVRLFDPYLRVAQSMTLTEDKESSKRLTEVMDQALDCLGLSCKDLRSCIQNEDFALPQDALLCEYSIREAVVFLIQKFDLAEHRKEAREWVRVLVGMEKLFRGGNSKTLMSHFKGKPEGNRIVNFLRKEQ